ncbi:hypothetical protein BG000_011902 [Podila horticola]|nr:hypothetical protein BG000_011902 [Podila horticola]
MSVSGARNSYGPPLVPIKESPFTHHFRPKLELNMPVPGKTRKRHKVATSCNRCRQNKRKCDSGVPCSNCKRNSADCLYTEAQQSRSTWGDSPLSKEKVNGVLVNQSQTTSNPSDPLPKTEPADKSLDGKIAPREGPPGSGSGPDTGLGPGSGSGTGTSTTPTSAIFNPGVASEETSLDRRKQVLTSQSKQISKAIRVAHPIPRYNTAQLFQNSGSKPPPITQPIVNSQIVAQGFPIQITVTNPHNSIPKTTWTNDTGQEIRRQGSIQGQTRGQGSQPYQRQSVLPTAPKHMESIGHGSDPPGMFAQQNTFPYYRDEDSQLVNGPGQVPNSQAPMDYTVSSNEYSSFSDRIDPSVVPPASTNGIDARQKQVSSIHQRHLELSQQLLADEPRELSQTFNYAMPQPTIESNPNFNLYPQQPDSSIPVRSPGIPTTSSVDKSQVSIQKQVEAARMQKIAKDMLDIKKYDYSIRLMRHISQEEDELWVAPHSVVDNDIQGIPSKLLLLPKDANYLVDVFFENACFYYPIVNRAVVELQLMEPQTPQALFLLNIIFMAACKHLARSTDIKRAVQFRERAREIQYYIDGRVRLSRMQANILGSQVIYGSFVIVIGMAQVAGTFGDLNLNSVGDPDTQGLDIQAECRSIQSKKGSIPEAAYQARLWAFWAYYIRDSMSRLYFGWPHGMDTMLVTAELPKIKGCIGLGGKTKNLMGASEIEGGGTRKRRESSFNRNAVLPGKKLMKAESRSAQTDQGMYRTTLSMLDDDEDSDNDTKSNNSDDSDDQGNDAMITSSNPSLNKRSTLKDALSRDDGSSLSGLSKSLLEQQSQGRTPTRRNSLGDTQETKRHMDRMKLLLEAEEDTTDGGSYARVLFLEEVKLWSIGRRVSLYLANRATSAPSSFDLDSEAISHPFGSAALSSSTSEASRCSERAWLRDQELQSIQADLIAWDHALPGFLRFRSDVDQSDVNHKVNGKMGILTMMYYTITLMLQSSYLPIPQYLSSSHQTSRASSYKSPESLSREFDGIFSRAMSTTSTVDETRIKLEDDYFRSSNTPRSPSAKGYFNTAHQICTQLSNVLYHHVEMLLDSYPNWCSIQSKINHTLIAAMRVSCLNARLSSNSRAIRDEAKAGFKYGSELFKRQALLPEPLTIRDWPAEEDVNVMENLEVEFRELMTSQEEDHATALRQELAEIERNYDPEGGEFHPMYEEGQENYYSNPNDPNGVPLPLDSMGYDIFQGQNGIPNPPQHVFGLGNEGFKFEYSMDA